MSKDNDVVFKDVIDDLLRIMGNFTQQDKALDKYTEELEAFNNPIKQKVNDLSFLIEGKDKDENKALYNEHLVFMQVSLAYLQEVARYYELRISFRNGINDMNAEILEQIKAVQEDETEESVRSCIKILDEWKEEIEYISIQIRDQMHVIYDEQKVVADSFNGLLSAS